VAPTALRYRLSGRVTDEFGTRLAGVEVLVDYTQGGGPGGPPSIPRSSCFGAFCQLQTLTDADGFYEVELDALPDSRLPGAFGYVVAARNGYQLDVQILPSGATPLTKNLRISTARRIDAGESTTVSLAVDSPFCWFNDEDIFDPTRRCEMVWVTAGRAGTLVLEAHAADGSAAPYINFGASGFYLGPPILTVPGTASVPVPAGTTAVLIGVPSGTAQRFEVSTSLR
jgi:hypothetical protein